MLDKSAWRKFVFHISDEQWRHMAASAVMLVVVRAVVFLRSMLRGAAIGRRDEIITFRSTHEASGHQTEEHECDDEKTHDGDEESRVLGEKQGRSADVLIGSIFTRADLNVRAASHQLSFDQKTIGTIFFQKIVVCAAFNDLAVIEYEDVICVADSGKSVGDDEAGAA